MADEQEYTAPDGSRWSSYHAYLYGDLCALCGCADPALEDDIGYVLLRLHDAGEQGDVVCADDLLSHHPSVYVQLILHVLTNADLIEHGSSMRWSWITPKGAAVAAELMRLEGIGEA